MTIQFSTKNLAIKILAIAFTNYAVGRVGTPANMMVSNDDGKTWVRQNNNPNYHLNDIFFIDSSHMIRPEGDVLYEVFNIFPLLFPKMSLHHKFLSLLLMS